VHSIPAILSTIPDKSSEKRRSNGDRSSTAIAKIFVPLREGRLVIQTCDQDDTPPVTADSGQNPPFPTLQRGEGGI